MQTASLELCKRLYDLSGWNGKPRELKGHYATEYDTGDGNHVKTDWICPAYDLGYLLRKLLPVRVHLLPNDEGRWLCHGTPDAFTDPRAFITTAQKADTPENAACKLAIRLFETGILKKGQA